MGQYGTWQFFCWIILLSLKKEKNLGASFIKFMIRTGEKGKKTEKTKSSTAYHQMDISMLTVILADLFFWEIDFR